MSNSFQINFNGGKSTGIKQYSYSQSNLSHTAKEAKMNTASTEIDYGETENFDYENYLVETEQKEVQVSPQEIEELRGKLKEYGFTDRDIERLISGEVTVEGLYEEILTDEKGERRRRLYEIEYLKSFGTEHKTKEELESSIETVTREIEKLREEQGSFQFTEEEAALGIINGLAIYGGDLDEIIENYIVGWEYIDENGVKQYEYSYNPNYMGGGVYSKPIYYKDIYGDSKYIEEIRNSLVETRKTKGMLWWEEEYTAYEWKNTEEQANLLNFLDEQSERASEAREARKAEYQERIDELTTKKMQEESILNYINQELDHYMENIDKYTIKEDFLEKCGVNSALQTRAEEYSNIQYDYNSRTIPSITINEKEDVLAIISAVINKQEGYKAEDYGVFVNSIIAVNSNDEILKNFGSWGRYVSEEEREVFNYIYNTEGEEEAYKYIKGIAGELDNRWLLDKKRKDAEWATANGFNATMASLASIVVTPFEGMNAAFHSIGSYFSKEEIRRVEVYSMGDTFRQAVSQDIYKNHGEGWSFAYNTLMSMADSGVLIVGSVATGGALGAVGVTSESAIALANTVISATTMGSRAYVNTLNDALDRGLSDGKSIALAFSSATVETLMESYSVGHLMNLEGKLGKATTNIVEKVTANISNPTLQRIAINSGYFALGAISQGVAEGEEEFCTEIANHYLDEMIAGELSSYNLAIERYMMEGKGEREARIQATKDYYNQVGMAFLGGFASGCLFGAGKIGINEFNTSRRVAKAINTEYKVTGIKVDSKTQNEIYASIIGIDSRYQDACIGALTGKITQEQINGFDGKVKQAIEEAISNYQRYDSSFTLEQESRINEISQNQIDTIHISEEARIKLIATLKRDGVTDTLIEKIFQGEYQSYSTAEEFSTTNIFKNEQYLSVIEALSNGYQVEELSSVKSLNISQVKVNEFLKILKDNNLTIGEVTALYKYSIGSNMILGMKRDVDSRVIASEIENELISRMTNEFGFSEELKSNILGFINQLDYSLPLYKNLELTGNYLTQLGLEQKYMVAIKRTVTNKDSFAHIGETLNYLDSALTHRLSNSIKLTRAVKSGYLLKSGESFSNLIGKTIENNGYISTSAVYETSFAKYDEFDTVFEIYAPEGTQGMSIVPFSGYGSAENEVLLNCNRFYVMDVNENFVDSNGRHKTLLKVIALSDIQAQSLEMNEQSSFLKEIFSLFKGNTAESVTTTNLIFKDVALTQAQKNQVSNLIEQYEQMKVLPTCSLEESVAIRLLDESIKLDNQVAIGKQYMKAAYYYLLSKGVKSEKASNFIASYLETLLENTLSFDIKNHPDFNFLLHFNSKISADKQIFLYNKFMSSFSRLPNTLRHLITSVKFYDTYNPADIHWEVTYNIKNFNSAATGGNGEINFWTGTPDTTLLAHEVAHSYDTACARDWGISRGRISESALWKDAMEADFKVSGKKGVSDYARSSDSSVEDFADSISYAVTSPNKLNAFPNRKALIEKFFKMNSEYRPSIDIPALAQAICQKYGNNFKNILIGYYIYGAKVDADLSYILSKYTASEVYQQLGQGFEELLGDVQDYKASDYSKSLSESVDFLVNKYGISDAERILSEYLNTGDISLLTTENGLRFELSKFGIDNLKNYIKSISDGDFSTQSLFSKYSLAEELDTIKALVVDKYGEGVFENLLHEYYIYGAEIDGEIASYLSKYTDSDFEDLLGLSQLSDTHTNYSIKHYEETFELAVNTLLSTVGIEGTIKTLTDYLSTGNKDILTTENNVRFELSKFGIDNLISYIKSINGNSLDMNALVTRFANESISFQIVSDSEVVDSSINLEDELAFFGEEGFINKLKEQVISNDRVNANGLTRAQQNLVNRINQQIAKTGKCIVCFDHTSEISSFVLSQVVDLDRLQVQMLDGLGDGNRAMKGKYNADRYIYRVTYGGREMQQILQVMEGLEARIDKTLPPLERARQAYRVLAESIPVMRDYARFSNGHVVAASFRGLIDQNFVGKRGLVCAGYASVFHELCNRIGVECEYITGDAIDPLRGSVLGRHAWNVLKINGELVPVDVTWYACSNFREDWFGPSDKFAKKHVADGDEIYNRYDIPLKEKRVQQEVKQQQNQNVQVNSNNIIQTLYQAMSKNDAKYGKGSGLRALNRYLTEGNSGSFTRDGNARYSMEQISISQLNQYLNQMNRDINSAIRGHDGKYGFGSGIVALQKLLEDGNYNHITSSNDARQIIRQYSVEELNMFINSGLWRKN